MLGFSNFIFDICALIKKKTMNRNYMNMQAMMMWSNPQGLLFV